MASAASRVPAARSESSAAASSTPRWWARSRAASRSRIRRYSTRRASGRRRRRSPSGGPLGVGADGLEQRTPGRRTPRGGSSRGTGRRARATARGAGPGGRPAPGWRRAPTAAASRCPRRRPARRPARSRPARRAGSGRASAWSGSAVRASRATSGCGPVAERRELVPRPRGVLEPEPQEVLTLLGCGSALGTAHRRVAAARRAPASSANRSASGRHSSSSSARAGRQAASSRSACSGSASPSAPAADQRLVDLGVPLHAPHRGREAGRLHLARRRAAPAATRPRAASVTMSSFQWSAAARGRDGREQRVVGWASGSQPDLVAARTGGPCGLRATRRRARPPRAGGRDRCPSVGTLVGRCLRISALAAGSHGGSRRRGHPSHHPSRPGRRTPRARRQRVTG